MLIALRSPFMTAVNYSTETEKFLYACRRNKQLIEPIVMCDEEPLNGFVAEQTRIRREGDNDDAVNAALAKLNKKHRDVLEASDQRMQSEMQEDITFHMVDMENVPQLPWGVVEALLPFIREHM